MIAIEECCHINIQQVTILQLATVGDTWGRAATEQQSQGGAQAQSTLNGAVTLQAHC
jgi:hypothetical protein